MRKMTFYPSHSEFCIAITANFLHHSKTILEICCSSTLRKARRGFVRRRDREAETEAQRGGGVMNGGGCDTAACRMLRHSCLQDAAVGGGSGMREIEGEKQMAQLYDFHIREDLQYWNDN